MASGQWEVKYPTPHFLLFVVSINSLDPPFHSYHSFIRPILDQHVPSAVARGLRLRGIDVTTTAQAGLQDADDPELIAFALTENRVIFTNDDDPSAIIHRKTGIALVRLTF